MAKETVIGVFEDRQRAERAAETLRERGFRDSEISVVGKGEGGQQARGPDAGQGGQRVSDGATVGAGVGAAGGLLAAAGALTIPGIGPLLAMGPLAATLGGAAVGGLAGGLVDFGIPEQRGRELENEVRAGRFLALVDTDADRTARAEEVLRAAGARNVERFRR